MWLVAAGSMAIVALVVIRLSPRHPPARTVDPLAAMDAQQALDRGLELGRLGRHTQSLPYFRRAAAAGGWAAHWDYHAAMNNAAFEVRSLGGMPSPASRSSFERAALAHAAFDELRLAEGQAPDRRTLAGLGLARGRMLARWGFPRDALEAYRGALAIDSTLATARRMIAESEAGFASPTPKGVRASRPR